MTHRIEDWAGNFIHGPFENPGDAEDWLDRHIEGLCLKEPGTTWEDWRQEFEVCPGPRRELRYLEPRP